MISKALGINDKGHLTIGNMDVCDLAKKYGTPLYIMDESYITNACQTYKNALKQYFGDNYAVAFASKAFSAMYIYKLLSEENMCCDVVSGGEIYTALKAGFNPQNMYFHGNNKTKDEINLALDNKVGNIVVDNKAELLYLNAQCEKKGIVQNIFFRIKPGIDAHTHDAIMTGKIDSKFGVALENGEAIDIVKMAIDLKNVRLLGIHCHIGSQIFDIEPFLEAVRVMMGFMKAVKDNLGYTIDELNIGGGFGIQYLESHDPVDVTECIKKVCNEVKEQEKKQGLTVKKLILEPGRFIVAPAGITVYEIGCVKEIKGVRTYVSVDGGMGDNPRYALYQSEYTVVLPEKMNEKAEGSYTIAGKCCESGDLLAKDIKMQKPSEGDLLAVLSTGAYNYSMASNYNRIPRLPVIMVKDGVDKVIVKRETYEDIIKNDII